MLLRIASSKARAQSAGGAANIDFLSWVRASISFNQCEEWAAMEHVANPCSAPRKERNDRGREIRLENYGLFARISKNLRGVRGIMVSHPGRGQCLLRLVREKAERSFERDETQAGPSS